MTNLHFAFISYGSEKEISQVAPPKFYGGAQ